MKIDMENVIRKLLEIREQKELLQSEEDALWQEVFKFADEQSGPGKPMRYLDKSTGYVIGRVVAVQEKLDEAKLESVLNHKQWLLVTVPKRVVEPTLLEAALTTGQVSRELVQACIERKEIARRFGPRPANKEERAELALEAVNEPA